MTEQDSSGNFWRDRRVFITGATGLVGHVLTGRLIEAGADVVALVRDQVSGAEFHRQKLESRCTTVRGDVTDYLLLQRILAEYEVETVFHLAAQTIVPIASRSPLSTFESNIRGTYFLMEAARLNPTVKQIVIASSDKAYGPQEELPYKESQPLAGQHPYDVSKSCADLISATYARTWGLPVCITRCANFYGPGDLNWNRLVPGTIRCVLRDEAPVIRSDGTPVRDYMYVEDGVLAYMLTAEQLASRPELAGEAFNFGVDSPHSVLEIVQTILSAMGSKLEPVILNEAHNEIPAQYLDASKAKAELGWSPQYSLDQGLAETVAWYRDYLTGESA